MATAVLQCPFQRSQYIFQQSLRLNDWGIHGLRSGGRTAPHKLGGLEALLEGGGGPIGGSPGDVSEVGTEKIKQDQANVAYIQRNKNGCCGKAE